MKKIILLIFAVGLLDACSSQEPIPTVSDYWKNDELRATTWSWCADSPGDRSNLPQCINVDRAKRQFGMMTGQCKKHGVLNQQCADDYFTKWVKK